MNPLHLLPGWALGKGPLVSIAATLSARVLDLPGYPGMPCGSSFDDAVDKLASALPAPCALGGWSLGAVLALATAARHPEKVARLVLIAGTPCFVARSDWPHGLPHDELATFEAALAGLSETGAPADPAALSSDLARTRSRFVGNFCRGSKQPRETHRTLLALADPLPSLNVLRTGLAWLREVDLRDELHAVRCPTLLLHGATDPLMPLAAAETLAERLPQTCLSVLDGVAHAPFIEESGACQHRIAEFLR